MITLGDVCFIPDKYNTSGFTIVQQNLNSSYFMWSKNDRKTFLNNTCLIQIEAFELDDKMQRISSSIS